MLLADGRARSTFSLIDELNTCASWPASAKVAPHVLHPHPPYVCATDRDPAGFGVEEAKEKMHEGRLARTALPDERDAPARLDPEAESCEHSRPARNER